jgi:ligand-binding sensor domain-containing protein
MNNKYFLTVLFSILFALTLAAQNYKDWRMHLSYHEAKAVAETSNRTFVTANGALYSYNKGDSEIRLYSKLNGLSDADISMIRYSNETRTLVIVYSNGNIDLLTDDGIRNMPYLKNATNLQSKNVNDIYFHTHLAYFSTDFGVMAVNLSRKEILDTYRLDRRVNSVGIIGETIYALTTQGVLQASLKDNLLDAGVWREKQINTSSFQVSDVFRMCVFQGHLVYCVRWNGIYYETSGGEVRSLLRQSYIKDMTQQQNELLAYTNADLIIYSDLNNHVSMTIGTIEDVTSLRTGTYWIASGVKGLIGIQKENDSQFTQTVSDIILPSPKRNYNAFMTVHKNKLLVAGGDRTIDRLRRPGTLMTYENDEWSNFDESGANDEIRKLIGTESWDYMSVAVHPDDENHYFIATYGEGIIELKDNAFVNLYNMNNSTLSATSNSGNSPNYVRIGSVAFDKDKNLWSTNGYTTNAINVLKPNGEWVSLYYRELVNADKLDKILITSRGHKWVNVPFDNAGIAVIDDRGTIDDPSDDICNFFDTFRDSQGNIRAGEYLCMAEDKNGTIWLGTNIGPLKISNPALAITNRDQLVCTRLVRDGDAYFLSGESVTAIAVDADNQKWIGTSSQGVFLINEDGSETILNFNTSNSPLLSNTINSIAVNQQTGEVFFGTNYGIISYLSGITTDSKPFSNVYAFPNPVRPEHSDRVTITGLTNNANVKITDINGNLLYQGRAVGNQFVWNCRSSNGARVATGVYLVLASTPDASESVVAKIAVVK